MYCALCTVRYYVHDAMRVTMRREHNVVAASSSTDPNKLYLNVLACLVVVFPFIPLRIIVNHL